MKQRIAIPVWGEHVSTTFDFARHVLLVEQAEGEELSRRRTPLPAGPEGWTVRALLDAGVDMVICGAVSQPLARAVLRSGIRLMPYVTGPVDDVLRACLGGCLDDPCFMLPGATPAQRRHWRHRSRHRCCAGHCKDKGDTTMKIAITSQGETIDAPVDQRFGRARCFILYEPATGEWVAHSNAQNLEAAQGAGIQAAQHVVELDVDAVITGHCGPKAFATLAAADVAVYTGASGSVKDAIDAYQSGALKAAGTADVASHFGSI